MSSCVLPMFHVNVIYERAHLLQEFLNFIGAKRVLGGLMCIRFMSQFHDGNCRDCLTDGLDGS